VYRPYEFSSVVVRILFVDPSSDFYSFRRQDDYLASEKVRNDRQGFDKLEKRFEDLQADNIAFHFRVPSLHFRTTKHFVIQFRTTTKLLLLC
jgi:hypothetical protein